MDFPQATQFLSALGELVQANAATLDALAAVPGRLYVMVIVGEGRLGKSTILNAIIARLAQRGLLADVRAAACGGVCQTFVTGPDVDPVTHGSRVCILRLRAGGAVVLIDSEGLLNRDRPFLNLQLGLLSQCTSRLVFVAHNVNDVLRDSIARLVGARLVEGAAPVMPYLHILLNLQVRPLELFAAAMDRWFDQGGDAAALNAAFPRERRSIGRLRAAREVLDGQTANAVLASYFGLDLIAWLNGFVDEWLAQPFTVNGVALTGAAFAMFVRESVSNTNAHVAAGRVIVQPAANLGALVAARCRCAVDHAIAVYDNDGSRPRSEAVTGHETRDAITAAHGVAATAATAAFIDRTSMFDTWPCQQGERQILEGVLAARLTDVLHTHAAQVARLDAEHRRLVAQIHMAVTHGIPAAGGPTCMQVQLIGGDGWVQVGQWRVGQTDPDHFSVSHFGGMTAVIFRSDGIVFPGPRKSFSLWDRPLGDGGLSTNVIVGDAVMSFGLWRLGQANVDDQHLSICHCNGNTSMIWRADGTQHPGPRRDFSTFGRALTARHVYFGNRFIQFGSYWRIGDVDGNHMSISATNGCTAVIYRSDGTNHFGPRRDWHLNERTCV